MFKKQNENWSEAYDTLTRLGKLQNILAHLETHYCESSYLRLYNFLIDTTL